MALKSMSIEKLAALRDRVEAALSSKVMERRRALESELSKLDHLRTGKSASKAARRHGDGKVAPKYRNSEDPSQTWAGRGLMPRWLTAAIKSGKKAEDFLVANSAAASKANARKKARSASVKATSAKAEVCPICDFQTTPPHDGRTHRYQKDKAPLSAAELKDKGLMKA